MATLTIRDLDDSLKLKLRLRAASQNRSMEEEARQILRAALLETSPPTSSLVDRVRRRFDGLGDVQLPIAPREAVREPLRIQEAPATHAPASKPANRSASARKKSRPATARGEG